MPVVDYNYDYYEYKNGKKVNKPSNTKRATVREDSSFSHAKTRPATKEQVRLAMYETPKRNTAKTTTKKTKNDLDIPTIRSKQSRTTSVNVASKPNRTALANTASKQNKLTRANTTAKQKREITTKVPKSKTTIAPKQQVKQKPVEMKLKKPELSKAQKKKAREKILNRIKNGLYLTCGFAIAFFICYRYSLMNEKFNELEKTKEKLATAQTVNEQIQADIDSQTDLSYIENYAKYQLGMQKPSNSQIVYVNVEKEDRILTPVTIEEDSSKTWLEQLYEEIAKLFE